MILLFESCTGEYLLVLGLTFIIIMVSCEFILVDATRCMTDLSSIQYHKGMSELLYYRTVGIISDRQTDKKEIQKSSIFLRFHVTPTKITTQNTTLRPHSICNKRGIHRDH